MSTRQQRIQSSKRNRAGLRILLKTLLALTIILGIGCLLLFIYQKTSVWLINVEVVKYGELQEATKAPAILMKRETVVKAPSRGRFENQVVEGERVRSGSVAGYYYPEGEIKPIPLLVPVSGVVSFKPDGWEDIMSNFSLDHGDQKIFDYSPRSINDGSFQYEPEEPLFKVVDNLAPLRLVVSVDRSAFTKPLSVGDTLLLRYQNQDLGKAVCGSAWSKEGNEIAILELNSFNETLLNVRRIEVECIIDTHQGLIIPEKSLVKKRTGYAVYRINGEKVELQSLKVLAILNGQAVVQGVEEGDTIITTPGLVSDGMAYR